MRKLVLVVACAVFVAGCLDSIIPAHTTSAPREADMSAGGNSGGGDMDTSTADGG